MFINRCLKKARLLLIIHSMRNPLEHATSFHANDSVSDLHEVHEIKQSIESEVEVFIKVLSYRRGSLVYNHQQSSSDWDIYCNTFGKTHITAMQLRLIFELLMMAVIVAALSNAATHSDRGNNWLGAELMIVRKVYDDCQDKNDFVGCLKEKALVAITKALEQDSIKIVDGLVLEKQNNTAKEGIMGFTDARTLSSLSELDRSLLEKVDQFLRTHVMKIDMSQGRGDKGGGGDKSKKGGGHVKYVVAALLTAMGIAGPIGLKALAAIAIKALVISKVALTIAGIIALKKLFSHDHQEETSFQVHAGDHNRRNAYVVRPMAKPTNAATDPAGVDPYRYYYEYH